MNKATFFAVMTACIGLSLFVSIFSAGTPMSLLQMPVEALHGLAFTFAWGLGFPQYLAYLAAILVLVAVAYTCYLIGKKIAKLIWR
ncbi:hypothetical protein VII00023_16275 [Vibrio ichthyoenteri ATCC 700023]|uniref:Uncharacterized protein n=1 Tax=Vibrio ichthyoenteri ATCC 700023 TaxID=870968 RepID=F9S0D5_9VIBR|nr:hypothetical protein [Vibrio ichthyoenteri]EGU43405.1 hypothetical protein VII00023_16275 [Vibrio ichthyoenteri ATCC 700023]